MFDNIGSKLITLAVVLCVVGIISSLICGIVFWNNGAGFGIMLGGSLSALISAWIIDGIGQANEEVQLSYSRLKSQVENTQRQLKDIKEILEKIAAQPRSESNEAPVPDQEKMAAQPRFESNKASDPDRQEMKPQDQQPAAKKITTPGDVALMVQLTKALRAATEPEFIHNLYQIKEKMLEQGYTDAANQILTILYADDKRKVASDLLNSL